MDKETSTKIKNEYIRKGKGISELSRKYGINRNTLQKIAVRGNWKEQREQYCTKRQQKTLEKITDEDSKTDVDMSRLKADIRQEIFMQINARLKRADLQEADFRRLTQCYKDMCDVEINETNIEESKAFNELLNAFGGVLNEDR